MSSSLCTSAPGDNSTPLYGARAGCAKISRVCRWQLVCPVSAGHFVQIHAAQDRMDRPYRYRYLRFDLLACATATSAIGAVELIHDSKTPGLLLRGRRVVRSICCIEPARKIRGLARGNIGSFQRRSQLDRLSRGPAGCLIWPL